MKVLLDTCVWGGARAALEALGHDVFWMGDVSSDPGDSMILQQAHAGRRVLVTLDKDFGELAIVRGIPHSGVIRLVGFRAGEQAAACHRALGAYGAELLAGAIVTMSPGRARIRSR